jgi:hypothetical protein
MIVKSETVADTLEAGYRRIVKDGMMDSPRWRVARLLVRLKKATPTERKRS